MLNLTVTGPQGAQGAQGTQGVAGPQGFQGSSGAQGGSQFDVIPGDIDTKLLLHFDGANNSTSFSDDSSSPLTSGTFSGAAVVSTAQSKFGGSSLYLDGAGTSKLKIANTNNKINFDNDFTLEGWFYLNNTAIQQPLFSMETDGDYQGPIIIYNFTGGQITFVGNTALGAPWDYFFHTAGVSISPNTWFHVAIVGKNLSSLKIYVNGVERGSSAYPAKVAVKNDGYIYPGHYPYLNGVPTTMNGYIDELRYSSIARYNSNFTPESQAFISGAVQFPSASTGVAGVDEAGNNLLVCTNGATNTWKKIVFSNL